MANREHLDILKLGVEVWNKWRIDNPQINPDLRDFDFSNATEFGKSAIWSEQEHRVYLMHANLASCDFWRSNLERVYFTGANLRFANLRGASLVKTNFHEADLTGANFSFARFDDNNVSSIRYSRRHMRGKWQGVRGAETIFGNAVFRRDVVDQDFIDTLWANGGWSLLSRLWLCLWSLTDYGRSWLAVVVFGVLAVTIFGITYQTLEPLGYISFTSEVGTINSFTPFYAAAMGFATLGLTSLVTPHAPFAQVLMIANVLSGFITLGLFLSVLANRFARRS